MATGLAAAEGPSHAQRKRRVPLREPASGHGPYPPSPQDGAAPLTAAPRRCVAGPACAAAGTPWTAARPPGSHTCIVVFLVFPPGSHNQLLRRLLSYRNGEHACV